MGKITLRELIYGEGYARRHRAAGASCKAVVPGGSSTPVLTADEIDVADGLRQRRQGGLDARLRRHHRDGRLDLHGVDGAATSPTSTSTSPAASARPAARARAGCCGCSTRIEDGQGDRDGPRHALEGHRLDRGKTVCPFGDAAIAPPQSIAREVPRRVRVPRAREAAAGRRWRGPSRKRRRAGRRPRGR